MDKAIEHVIDEVELLNEMADALLHTVHEMSIAVSTLDQVMGTVQPESTEATTESK